MKLGTKAPTFCLKGTDGEFCLDQHLGETVVLLFYPGDETLVCTKQFCSYRDNSSELDALDATFVGISAQTLKSHRDFISHHKLNVPLLSDPKQKVAELYGVKGMVSTKRAVFIVDKAGSLSYQHVHKLGVTFMTLDKIAVEVKKLQDPQPA